MSKRNLLYTLPIQVSLYNDYDFVDLNVEIFPTFKNQPGVLVKFPLVQDKLQSSIDDIFADIVNHGFSYTATDNTIDFPNSFNNTFTVKIKVLVYGDVEKVMTYLNKLTDKTNGCYNFNGKEKSDDQDRIS